MALLTLSGSSQQATERITPHAPFRFRVTGCSFAASIVRHVDATFLFMMLALKVPIAALIWIVWWAIKQEPETAAEPGGDGGARRPAPRHPRPPRPRRPRRGGHGDPPAPAPARVRSVVARARRVEH